MKGLGLPPGTDVHGPLTAAASCWNHPPGAGSQLTTAFPGAPRAMASAGTLSVKMTCGQAQNPPITVKPP